MDDEGIDSLSFFSFFNSWPVIARDVANKTAPGPGTFAVLGPENDSKKSGWNHSESVTPAGHCKGHHAVSGH